MESHQKNLSKGLASFHVKNISMAVMERTDLKGTRVDMWKPVKNMSSSPE